MIFEGIAGLIGIALSLAGTKPRPRWSIQLHPAILSDSPSKLLDRGIITGRFLERRSASHLHRGIDIAAPLGTNIYSIQDGKVIGIYPDGIRSGYGNSILILHSDGFASFYAHLNSIENLVRGDDVFKGQFIGTVGSTGTNHSHAHLHLEILKGLTFKNPKPTINENTPDRINPIDYLARNNVTIGRTRL